MCWSNHVQENLSSSFLFLLFFWFHLLWINRAGVAAVWKLTERGAHPGNVRLQVVCELRQLLQQVGALLLNVKHTGELPLQDTSVSTHPPARWGNVNISAGMSTLRVSYSVSCSFSLILQEQSLTFPSMMSRTEEKVICLSSGITNRSPLTASA